MKSLVEEMAKALLEQLFSETGFGPWGTDRTMWSLLAEDVASLDPARIAKSTAIMEDAAPEWWDKDIGHNMLAFMQAAN